MKIYGRKDHSAVCECSLCGTNKKKQVKKRERQKAKKEITKERKPL